MLEGWMYPPVDESLLMLVTPSRRRLPVQLTPIWLQSKTCRIRNVRLRKGDRAQGTLNRRCSADP